jgi:hypothetical protein
MFLKNLLTNKVVWIDVSKILQKNYTKHSAIHSLLLQTADNKLQGIRQVLHGKAHYDFATSFLIPQNS